LVNSGIAQNTSSHSSTGTATMTRYSFEDSDEQVHRQGPAPPVSSMPAPNMHPGSAFERLRMERLAGYQAVGNPAPTSQPIGYGQEGAQSQAYSQPQQFTPYTQPQASQYPVDLRQPTQAYAPPQALPSQTYLNSQNPQAYPPYRDQSPGPLRVSPPQGNQVGRDTGYTTSMVSTTTPGADNYGETAAGGIAGIAYGVADNRPRESGMEAMRNTPGYRPDYDGSQYSDRQHGMGGPGFVGYDQPPHPGSDLYSAYSPRNEYGSGDSYHQGYDPRDRIPYGQSQYPHPAASRSDNSQASGMPLTAAAVSPAMSRQASQGYDNYHPTAADTVLNRYSQRIDPGWNVNPDAIVDDDDDGLDYTRANRSSMLSLGRQSDRLSTGTGATGSGNGAAGAAGAAGAGIMGTLGGLVAKKPSSTDAGPLYGRVEGLQSGLDIPTAYSSAKEKNERMLEKKAKRRKITWIVAIIFFLLVAGGVGGGVAGTIMSNKNKSGSSASSSGSSGGSAAQDSAKNGDLSKDSDEIKALMNNKDLHKVFPGIDYTPMYTQYPECLSYPASQNNVTRDLAVISQLTNVIRLYGTDCNQTELVLHSLDRLGLNDSMKVWLGVWQDKNATTNARQLSQMYNILETYGTSPFLGVIVGNEIMFREDMTEASLITLIENVKANFTKLKYDLPIATSDIGDKWTQAMANEVDYLMANIHPFFTGKVIDDAAEFTWQFWQNQNFPLKPDLSKNFIGETGWPTAGGTDCGSDLVTSCAQGSLAGISELNQFMEQWVCNALKNGTNYFWFEAFDEPWKIKFNTKGKEWEDQWGLMDVDRNIKSGVKIPDCGGTTVPSI
jgi:exo-beta-1,3-glucanase (GH17 family)